MWLYFCSSRLHLHIVGQPRFNVAMLEKPANTQLKPSKIYRVELAQQRCAHSPNTCVVCTRLLSTPSPAFGAFCASCSVTLLSNFRKLCPTTVVSKLSRQDCCYPRLTTYGAPSTVEELIQSMHQRQNLIIASLKQRT